MVVVVAVVYVGSGWVRFGSPEFFPAYKKILLVLLIF